MALISGMFVAYGGASLQLQGFVLAGYVSAIWFIAGLAMLFYRPRASLRIMMANRVCAGEKLPIDLDVQQRGRSRGADLVVLPHKLPLAIDSVPDEGVSLPDLRRGETHRVRLALRCDYRGSYTVPGFRIETSFPFGILRARRIVNEPQALLVYPKFTALSRLTLPTGRRYQPGGVALASNLGESFEFLGNREYREGDNIRDIDWRATARIQRPIVREYREEYFLRVAVILDTHVPKPSRKQQLNCSNRSSAR